MGEIRLSIGQVGISGYLMITVAQAATPTLIVAQKVIPPPVPTTQNIVFTDLDDVVHLVSIRNSSDGVTPGTLLNQYVYDVRGGGSGSLMFERRFYTELGNDDDFNPATGRTEITDPYIADKIVYGVFKEGFRYLKDDEWEQDGGVLRLLNSSLSPGETLSYEVSFVGGGGSGGGGGSAGIFERRFYIESGLGADYDPEVGTTEITDMFLANHTVTGVFKEGFSYLPPSEWKQEGTKLILLNTSVKTGESLVYEIFEPGSSSSGGASFPKDIIEITEDTTISATHYNAHLEINGGAGVLKLTFPQMITIPEKTKISIDTESGEQTYVELDFGSGSVKYNGELKSKIWIGRKARITIIKKGDHFRIENWDDTHLRVGERVYSETQPENSLAATGGWIAGVGYPRLLEYVQRLPPELRGSGMFPNQPDSVNRIKFILHGTWIWIPDTQGYFIRNTDFVGTVDYARAPSQRLPGTFQDSANKAHTHEIPVYATTDSGSGYITGGKYVQSDASVSTLSHGEAESRPKNITLNQYIII